MHDQDMRSADRLAATLIRSKLASPAELEQACQRMPGHVNAADLANQLVNDGILTNYQASTALRNQIGSLICGDYVILDRIGQGGMGQVYKAMHRRMERIVALKVLTRLAAVSPETVERFRREAEVVASLDHPNIVQAYDARIDRKRTYLIMEHIDGVDLAELVERDGALPTQLACQYVLQAARGLAHAHQHNVVHRDVKPSNLIVDAAGVVKILDLGVARLQSSSVPDEPKESRLTDEGQVLGTVAFMAPEQAEDSRNADEKSDIYSLGCTLYFLLTGRLPYNGASIIETFEAHRNEPVPSLSQFRLDASPRLQRVFERTMAKFPAQRFACMEQLVAELRVCLEAPSAVASEVAPSKATPRPKRARWKSTRVDPRTDTFSIPKRRARPVENRPSLNAETAAKPGSNKSSRVRLALVGCITAALILSTGVYAFYNNRPAPARSKADSLPAASPNPRQGPGEPMQAVRGPDELLSLDEETDSLRVKHQPLLDDQTVDPPVAGQTVGDDAAPQAGGRPASVRLKPAQLSGSETVPVERTGVAPLAVAEPAALVESDEPAPPMPVVDPPGFMLTLITGKRNEQFSSLEAAWKRLDTFVEVRERAAERRFEPLPMVATITVAGQQFALDDAGDALEVCESLRTAESADDPLTLVSRIAGPAIDIESLRNDVHEHLQQKFPAHLDRWVDEKQRMPSERDVRRLVKKIVALGKAEGRIPVYFKARFSTEELDDLFFNMLAEKSEQLMRDTVAQSIMSASAFRPPPRPHNHRPPR